MWHHFGVQTSICFQRSYSKIESVISTLCRYFLWVNYCSCFDLPSCTRLESWKTANPIVLFRQNVLTAQIRYFFRQIWIEYKYLVPIVIVWWEKNYLNHLTVLGSTYLTLVSFGHLMFRKRKYIVRLYLWICHIFFLCRIKVCNINCCAIHNTLRSGIKFWEKV